MSIANGYSLQLIPPSKGNPAGALHSCRYYVDRFLSWQKSAFRIQAIPPLKGARGMSALTGHCLQRILLLKRVRGMLTVFTTMTHCLILQHPHPYSLGPQYLHNLQPRRQVFYGYLIVALFEFSPLFYNACYVK